jgi:hypothetical protein
MNKGFLNLIDLSLNIQRGMQAIRGVTGGVAAMMAVGLTVLACGLAPLVWYFDLSATMDYAGPLITQLAPTLPARVVAFSSFVVLAVTLLPTIVELLLPRIGASVQAAAFLVFGFSAIDAITDWPRVVTVMAAYRGGFEPWGVPGLLLWYVLHPVLLLFSTFLFELLFVLCLALILVLVLKIALQDTQARRVATAKDVTP